jgi:spoIIIJ-associated protein
MSEDREFYAATVDEAVGKAADELGMPAEEVSYAVLDEGNSGFLGIGARDARILVTTTVSTPETAFEADEPGAAVPDDADDASADSLDEEPPDIGVSSESSPLAEVYGESSDSEQAEAPQ